jgi:ribonucleoside-diphosphate reductase alpha chain
MPESTTVFYFPMRAPDGAITKDDVTATNHLQNVAVVEHHWAEHQVSVTVSVRENEWMKVGAWVYENFDDITGISFLPFDGGSYKQAPFQAITEEEYHAVWRKHRQPSTGLCSLNTRRKMQRRGAKSLLVLEVFVKSFEALMDG